MSVAVWAPQKAHWNTQNPHQSHSKCKQGNFSDCCFHSYSTLWRCFKLKSRNLNWPPSGFRGWVYNYYLVFLLLSQKIPLNAWLLAPLSKYPPLLSLQRSFSWSLMNKMQPNGKWTYIDRKKKECLFFSWTRRRTDKDLIFDQTLLRLPWTFQIDLDFWTSNFMSHCPILAIILLSWFNHNPLPPYQITLDIWSGSSSFNIPQVMSDHLGMPSARI